VYTVHRTSKQNPTIAGLISPHATEFAAMHNSSSSSAPRTNSVDAKDCLEGCRRSSTAETSGRSASVAFNGTRQIIKNGRAATISADTDDRSNQLITGPHVT
jgi:hypothetical protein